MLTKRMVLTAAIAVTFFNGCRSTNNNGSTAKASDDSGPVPTITFPSDFSDPVLSGTLTAGGMVKVLYSQSRLTTFKECYVNGQPTKGLNPNFSVDGGSAISSGNGDITSVAPVTLNATTYSHFKIKLPAAGHDLALWFVIANKYGQCGVDSNNNANYHFNLN